MTILCEQMKKEDTHAHYTPQKNQIPRRHFNLPAGSCPTQVFHFGSPCLPQEHSASLSKERVRKWPQAMQAPRHVWQTRTCIVPEVPSFLLWTWTWLGGRSGDAGAHVEWSLLMRMRDRLEVEGRAIGEKIGGKEEVTYLLLNMFGFTHRQCL